MCQMTRRPLLLGMLLLSACTHQSTRDDAMLREAFQGVGKPVPTPLPTTASGVDAANDDSRETELDVGTGEFVKPVPLNKPHPTPSGGERVNFDFQDQPIQAVISVILGDLLKQPYTIAPGVEGKVTFSTAEPVDRSQALPILEMLLSWTDSALVHKGTGYMVLPAKQALAGNVVPRVGVSAPQAGWQARLFPLHYIAASEMQKLLAPFAKPDAVLQADDQRNLLTLAGNSEDLENYQRAIEAFDVNWLKGMSVAVFSLQHTDVASLQAELDKLFGPKSGTPVAGMVRFIPMEQTNTLIAISGQPAYLQEVSNWVERIDRGRSNQPQLYVYDAQNIDASDLAGYLNDIYGSGNSNSSTQGPASVAPGLTPSTITSAGGPGAAGPGLGSSAPSFGSNSGMTAAPAVTAGNKQQRSSTSQTLDNGVRVTATDHGNQLLVRASAEQWAEMLPVIKRLDTMPLQVQVEMRVLEVKLTGAFQFGVQWYLQGLAGQRAAEGKTANPRQVALGRGGSNYQPNDDTLFYSFVNRNMQVALHAMESSGNTKVLSAPSVIVANKEAAHVQVGDRIPITQNYIDTSGNADTTVGNVQYEDTGVILDVTPRINPGGLVYLTVGQQVSNVDTTANADSMGNPTIQERQITTHAIVRSGQTVLLGGLIQQDDSEGRAKVPLLGDIPVLGRLFGNTSRSHDRTELIVLITPTVISSGEDARRITEEYKRKLKALQPSEVDKGQDE
jgi:general secretion pathway protein D